MELYEKLVEADQHGDCGDLEKRGDHLGEHLEPDEGEVLDRGDRVAGVRERRCDGGVQPLLLRLVALGPQALGQELAQQRVIGERISAPVQEQPRPFDAIAEVARYLGNTPAVARSSYIDPRVVDRFMGGETILGALEKLPLDLPEAERQRRVETAVLDLLAA